jgi:hypothetical protein
MSKMKRYGKTKAFTDKVITGVTENVAEATKEFIKSKKVVHWFDTHRTNSVENIERMLKLKRKACAVKDCGRPTEYWTPNGEFCHKHREEAMAAMKAAKLKRYHGS